MLLRSGKETKFNPNLGKRKNRKMAKEKENKGEPGTSQAEAEPSNFDFKVFNAMVPTFRGNKNELRKFIDSGDLYVETLNDAGEEEFEKLIMLKLDSYIYNWCQNKGVDSWEEIKDNLKRKYKTTSNLPLLQKELFAIRQDRRESVGEFGERIEKKLFEMNEVARGEIEEFDVGRYRQYHEKLALRAFQDGLKDTLRIYIKARNYETLSEAITEAMNEEAYTTDGNSEQKGEKGTICYRCGRKGHLRNQCFVRMDGPNRSEWYRNNTNNQNQNSRFDEANRPQAYRNSNTGGDRHQYLNGMHYEGRAYQAQGNFPPRNFENNYRNNNAQGNPNGGNRAGYDTRQEQRNVRFSERAPKNGERLVGRPHHPTI